MGRKRLGTYMTAAPRVRFTALLGILPFYPALGERCNGPFVIAIRGGRAHTNELTGGNFSARGRDSYCVHGYLPTRWGRKSSVLCPSAPVSQ